MLIILAVLALSWAGEWLLTYQPVWRYRHSVSMVSLLLLSAACAAVWVRWPGIWAGLISLIGLYRGVNLLRVLEDRMHEMYARHTVRRTAAWLGAAQALAAGLLVLSHGGGVTLYGFITVLAAFQVASAALAAVSLRRSMDRTRPRHESARTSDAALPSVTVAIPARNEDAQLEACLTAVLASDYPKLEVIVLDDCSGDRTPDIIRSFAHAGVRFVRGSEPHDGWLAKNQAYERLYKEASGTLILFCGVDVRLGRHSIRQLVANLRIRNKAMVSVLPRNTAAGRLPLVQAMRYYWELVPPRRMFNRPPVLSSCWLVSRECLRELGGFGGFRRSITPEAHIARHAITHDGYAFLRSDEHLGVASEKPARDQVDTAVQTRYPQLHRRPELVLAVALAELLLLAAPLPVLSYGLYVMQPALCAAAAVSLLVHTRVFARLQRSVFPHSGLQADLHFLPAILLDIGMLHYSMYKYEFSEVFWRGRNVCYPVMHVVPRLPKI